MMVGPRVESSRKRSLESRQKTKQELPTTYEYFTEGGITSGLTADTPGFFK
jgi:hypothetical protein